MQTIKESSDELNPAVVTHAVIAPPPRSRTLRDYLALSVATCGVGYLPIAPGTFGAAVGMLLYIFGQALALSVLSHASSQGWSLPPVEAFGKTLILMMLILITCIGIWAATRAESLLSRKDPGPVVVDEIAGQLITFLFVPINSGPWVIGTGFIAFRIFDIWKPYPIRRLEALESGLGIMADDLVAGIYAGTLLSFLTSLFVLL